MLRVNDQKRHAEEKGREEDSFHHAKKETEEELQAFFDEVGHEGSIFDE